MLGTTPLGPPETPVELPDALDAPVAMFVDGIPVAAFVDGIPATMVVNGIAVTRPETEGDAEGVGTSGGDVGVNDGSKASIHGN